MAGVTREAKAALERLPDRISIGVLAAVFTKDLIDEVIDESDVREVRSRRLPARLMVIFVLVSWLYMRSGYGLVMSKLADGLAVQGRGWGDWEAPGTGSIAKARVRLSAAPLRLLFARVAGPTGTAATPGVFYAGRRVLCLDGFTLDLPDTPENDEQFGRGSTAGGVPGPYPQLRAVAVAEAGTRSLVAAAYGGYHDGEQTLAANSDVLGALGPGMLVLADRNFPSFKLCGAVAATGADWLWRMSASFTLPILEVLDDDGTYLSELRPPRKRDGPPIRVRVIEYTVLTTDADGEQVCELFSPGHHPARPRAGPRRRVGGALPRPVAGRDRHRGAQDRDPRRPRGGAALEDPRDGRPGVLGDAVRLPGRPSPDRPGRATGAGPEPDQLQTHHRRRPGLRDPGGSLPPRHLNTALRHLFTQLRKPSNLTPLRPGRAAPRQCKRGGSNRYDRRPTDTPAVQTVTYEIVLHPLAPRSPT